jgi:hypothetical protein
MTDAATSLSTVLVETARRVLPGGNFGGCRMTDVADKTYINFLMRCGPMMLGHAHLEVVAAVPGKLAKGTTPVRRLERQPHRSDGRSENARDPGAAGTYDRFSGTKLMNGLQSIWRSSGPSTVLVPPALFDVVFAAGHIHDYRGMLWGNTALLRRLNQLRLERVKLRRRSTSASQANATLKTERPH